jgi:hypothetical protein
MCSKWLPLISKFARLDNFFARMDNFHALPCMRFMNEKNNRQVHKTLTGEIWKGRSEDHNFTKKRW